MLNAKHNHEIRMCGESFSYHPPSSHFSSSILSIPYPFLQWMLIQLELLLTLSQYLPTKVTLVCSDLKLHATLEKLSHSPSEPLNFPMLSSLCPTIPHPSAVQPSCPVPSLSLYLWTSLARSLSVTVWRVNQRAEPRTSLPPPLGHSSPLALIRNTAHTHTHRGWS